MKIPIFSLLCYLLILPFASIDATHLVAFKEGDQLKPLEAEYQKEELYKNLMLCDEPRSLFHDHFLKIEQYAPELTTLWIPPLLWQCACLDTFFTYAACQKFIDELGEQQHLGNFDKAIVTTLKQQCRLDDLIAIFDRWIDCKGLCEFFFTVNNHTLKLYLESQRDPHKMLCHLLEKLSSHQLHLLPFFRTDQQLQRLKCLQEAFNNHNFLQQLLSFEILAKNSDKQVFYRGTTHRDFSSPSLINQLSGRPHALSFGSSLLGGIFFAADACALCYAYNEQLKPNHFIAVGVAKEWIVGDQSLFRTGALHPFLQMLCQGEFFHSHTKVIPQHSSDFTEKSIHGYYASCNKLIDDPLGYVVTYHYDLTRLTQALKKLFQTEGEVFLSHE